MDYDLLTEPHAVARLEPEWRRIGNAHPAETPFNHPAWTAAWLAQRSANGARWRCITGRGKGGNLECVLPLVRTADGVVRFCGYDLLDSASALANQPDLPHLWGAAMRLIRQFDGPARLDLPCVADADLAAIRAVTNDVCETGLDPGAYIPLSGGWDTYVSTLSNAVRKRLRAGLRRLERDHGSTMVEVVDHPGDVPTAVEALWTMREDSWRRRGRYEELAPWTRGQPMARFLVELAVRGAADGMPVVVRLVAGEHRVAMAALLLRGSAAWYYLCTFDPTYAAVSPGVLLLTECVRHCVAARMAVLDLGRGDEPYKLSAGGVRRVLKNVTVTL